MPDDVIVWIVMAGTIGIWQVDSVWSSKEKALAYIAEAEAEFNLTTFNAYPEILDHSPAATRA